MELKKESVIAVLGEKDELVCNKCATDKDWAAVGNKARVFLGEKFKAPETLYFCDKCGTRLKG